VKRKIRGSFCERSVAPRRRFDRRSFRWVRSGKNWVLIGCQKGKWKRGRCSIGTRAVKVLAKSAGACAVGRRVTK